MNILAIDPGPIESAWVIWDGKELCSFALEPNLELITRFYDPISDSLRTMVIEQVQCFGMPVGKSIFETVFWSGRFCERWPYDFHRLARRDVKLHLCNSARAKDSNVIQALVDRFAPYEKNKGKGTKKEPGFFYGFKKDIWQAMALAVTWHDTHTGGDN